MRDCALRRAPRRCARGRGPAAERAQACSRPAAGGSRCSPAPCPRPRGRTFTKLSASGNPGSTISSSDLATLEGLGALASAGLGGAMFSACMALLARLTRADATWAHCACAKWGAGGAGASGSHPCARSPRSELCIFLYPHILSSQQPRD